jgi:hypothetical protein
MAPECTASMPRTKNHSLCASSHPLSRGEVHLGPDACAGTTGGCDRTKRQRTLANANGSCAQNLKELHAPPCSALPLRAKLAKGKAEQDRSQAAIGATAHTQGTCLRRTLQEECRPGLKRDRATAARTTKSSTAASVLGHLALHHHVMAKTRGPALLEPSMPQETGWENRRGSGTRMVVLRPRRLTLPRNNLLFQSSWPANRSRPRGHFLAALAASPSGTSTCLLSIWGSSAPEASGRFRTNPPSCTKLRLHPFQRAVVLPLLRDMLDRAVALPYIPMLQSICPIPAQCQPRGDSAVKAAPLTLACAPQKVVAFVHAVLGKLIPDGLLGPSKKAFMQHVAAFLSLKRFEAMSVHELLQGVATKGIEWLHAWCAICVP